MKCPYCGEEMIKGYIYGDRYKLKWMPEDKKLLLGIWAMDGIKLGEGGNFGRARAKSCFCHSCNKLIIDINE